MKKLIFIFLIIIQILNTSAIIYLSPNGSDATGSGTFASPYFTLDKAWTVVSAGDTIYMRGGTYTFEDTQELNGVNGTAGNLIKVWAYPDESPKIVKAETFSYDSFVAGLHLTGNYIHFKGIEMAGFTQQTNSVYHTFLARNCSYCIFEELNCHHGAFGFYLMENGGGTATGNLILNCDFHHNYDPLTVSPQPYGNADGMAIGYVTHFDSYNVVIGCRFYRNSDDGIDLWSNEGATLIEDCWSWHNGYREDGVTNGGDGNGFKLGDVTVSNNKIRKTVKRCLAAFNYDMGFTQNSWTGTRANPCALYNNIAYKCGAVTGKGPGFQFGSALVGTVVNIFRNNIGYQNWNNVDVAKETVDISVKNTWDGGFTVSDADFMSVDSTGISGARVNGNKPSINFLKLAPSSDLIDAGTETEVSFYGSKPDLGPNEYITPGNLMRVR